MAELQRTDADYEGALTHEADVLKYVQRWIKAEHPEWPYRIVDLSAEQAAEAHAAAQARIAACTPERADTGVSS